MPEIMGLVNIEFYKLQESDEFDESGGAVLYPVGPNLCQDGNIDFVVEEDAPYGVKIVNNSRRNFYAYLFYFDNNDFSISEPSTSNLFYGALTWLIFMIASYYQTPAAPRGSVADFLLKKHDTLTIGYGSRVSVPFCFTLFREEGRKEHTTGEVPLKNDRNQYMDMDVGFLKLFISTEAIELSHIPQLSPFQTIRSSGLWSERWNGIWDTILVPIIQRQHPIRQNL